VIAVVGIISVLAAGAVYQFGITRCAILEQSAKRELQILNSAYVSYLASGGNRVVGSGNHDDAVLAITAMKGKVNGIGPFILSEGTVELNVCQGTPMPIIFGDDKFTTPAPTPETTPSATATPTPTPTPTPNPTATPIQTATPAPTPSPDPSATPTPTPTAVPADPSGTATPTPAPGTPAPSSSPSPSPTATATPSPTPTSAGGIAVVTGSRLVKNSSVYDYYNKYLTLTNNSWGNSGANGMTPRRTFLVGYGFNGVESGSNQITIIEGATTDVAVASDYGHGITTNVFSVTSIKVSVNSVWTDIYAADGSWTTTADDLPEATPMPPTLNSDWQTAEFSPFGSQSYLLILTDVPSWTYGQATVPATYGNNFNSNAWKGACTVRVDNTGRVTQLNVGGVWYGRSK